MDYLSEIFLWYTKITKERDAYSGKHRMITEGG